MATVHLGRLRGPAGFSRTVAIKRLHEHLAREPEFECLTARRLFADADKDRGVERVLTLPIPAPSTLRPDTSSDLDRVVLRALARDPDARYASAEDFAHALYAVVEPACPADVGK